MKLFKAGIFSILPVVLINKGHIHRVQRFYIGAQRFKAHVCVRFYESNLRWIEESVCPLFLPIGKQLVRIYYEKSKTVTEALESHEFYRKIAAALLERIIPVIEMTQT